MTTLKNICAYQTKSYSTDDQQVNLLISLSTHLDRNLRYSHTDVHELVTTWKRQAHPRKW